MKTILIGALVVVVLAGVGAYYTALLQAKNQNTVPNEPVACTMEAKICPDGTAVGRTGPNCEFAACPIPAPHNENPSGLATSTKKFTIALNEMARTPSLLLIPTQVVEDSRCARDVQCIWAGRVIVRATLGTGMGTSTADFAVDSPITTEVDTIVLREVTPYPESVGSIKPADYRFVFEVTPR